MGSITLNNSDFQCLQDQLVDLKAKNYDLAEKNRRSQADFEAAKARICSLQLKLEEQERDFQIISTTLRREIEALTGGSGLILANQNCDNNAANKQQQQQRSEETQENFAAKCKELALKVEELEQKYQESKEIAQQLDNQNRELVEKLNNIQEANSDLKAQFNGSTAQIETLRKEAEVKLANVREEAKQAINEEKTKLNDTLSAITSERDSLRQEVDRLKGELGKFEQKLEVENEERKIQERKGMLMVKELKRQLAQEKNRKETLQKRIEHLLSAPPAPAPIPLIGESSTSNTTTTDIDVTLLSTSSSTNGNGSGGGGNAHNQDTNSVGSWSFVPVKTTTSTTTSNSAAKSNSNTGLNETISLCSVESEDRETVQRLCDTTSSNGSSKHQNTTNNSDSNSPSYDLQSSPSPFKKDVSQATRINDVIDGSFKQTQPASSSDVYFPLPSSLFNTNDAESKGMLIEEQAALVERLTKLQHDKWQLEEKLSYMEQANSSLTEDLANKSDIIKQYFMHKAIRALNTPQPTAANANNHHDGNYDGNYNLKTSGNINNNNNPRRLSFPSNINEIISEKPSLKKVVDFLKEKSHNPLLLSGGGDSENISKEATKKMQLMLEETLIKCLKLQENLDFVTSELNKVKK